MKEVTDIQLLRVELDAEDQELMMMFKPRQRVLNDRLLVEDGADCYLISKSWLAHKRKQMEDTVRACVTGAGIMIAILAMVCMYRKIGSPMGWLGVLGSLGLIAGSLGLAREIK